MPLQTKTEEQLALFVAEKIHAEKPLEAAQAIKDVCQLKVGLEDNPAKYNPVLLNYLHFLLDYGAPEYAARMLWTTTQFNPEPKSTKEIWNLYDDSSLGLLMGAGSMSKSYSMGVRLFLEWIRDPEWTSIRVIGPSAEHLEENLFSNLVSLHSSARLPMPGTVGELFIGLSRRNQLSAIKGVVIPIGKVKKAGRLQGGKRKPRPEPHPLFGPLSRLFIFLDEFENIPGGIWSDIDNVLSNIQEEGAVEGFKLFGAYNPSNQYDEVAKRAEPPFGWAAFDLDKHFRWKSSRGWDVLRLDGEKSENVVQGKEVYAGLQTRAGLETIARNSGGRNSPGYYTMGRGAYPPQGIELTIIPPGMLPKFRGEYIWFDTPKAVGSADLALEGGANAIYTLGKWGRATGIKYPPSLEHPTGHKVMFKDRMGQTITRWGAQADQQFIIPKGETVAMKNRLIELNRKAAVRGEFFACDRTGGGAGIADLMKYEWSSQIHAVNYSEGASQEKLMIEDSLTCAEQFERMWTELWFALKSWGEFGYFLINPAMDMSKLAQQLTQRKFRTAGKKTRVESKKDYMGRGYSSPDEADSLTLFVHAARKGSGVTLSMKMDESSDIPGGEDDGWWDELPMKGGAYVDFTNKTDFLDDGARPVSEAIL